MSKYDSDFERIWNEQGIEAIIRKYKVTRRAAISKASELRKSGANIKEYKGTPQGYKEKETVIDIEKEMGYGRYRKLQINDEEIEIEQDFVKDEEGI